MTPDRSHGSAVASRCLPPPVSLAETARAWRAGLPPERRRPSDLRGGLIFAIGVGAYLLTFVGMFRLPAWWMQAACVPATAIALGFLFIAGHDGCHGSLVRSYRLNRLLGRLAFLPAWHPVASWVHVHNSQHHAWTNLKGRDPGFCPFTKEEFDRLPAWRRLLERVCRSPLGVGLGYATDFYLGRLLFPGRAGRPPSLMAFHLDRLMVAAFAALQFAVAVLLARGAPDRVLPVAAHAAAAVLLPWALFVWFIGFVTWHQHTHPLMPWYDDEAEWSFYHVNMTSTAHVVFPWPVKLLLNNINDHVAHHIDPGIPLYELPDSQRRLNRACAGQAFIIRWTPWEYLRVCAACKLYDFKRRCWTDFAGRPTGPRLPGPPPAASRLPAPPRAA
jgi:acyl-lipid omega-6 desaturase (Delta-12 desaturase)